MSAAGNPLTVLAALGTGGTLVGASISPTIRKYIETSLGKGAVAKMWKYAALAYAIANFKNLPLIWHVRVLRGIIYQIYFQPTPQQPKHLFAPLITSSYNTIADCDYNLHKSNSTYFTDLDVSRAHHMGAIIREGLRRLNSGDESGLSSHTTSVKGKYFVALGAVSCFFRRQIEPLQSFEIYTRVLTWDRKWLYLVSHIVQKGKLKPDAYVLQPWKRGARVGNQEGEDLSKYIFATSVSRYVFKKGRLTINPEIVLERSRLLPPRPEGVGFPPRAEGGSESGDSTPEEGAERSQFVEVDAPRGETAGDAKVEEWTWDDMERERLRGLDLAIHFDKLEASHKEIRSGEVLGRYGDYF